jgi:hypothetical protein
MLAVAAVLWVILLLLLEQVVLVAVVRAVDMMVAVII